MDSLILKKIITSNFNVTNKETLYCDKRMEGDTDWAVICFIKWLQDYAIPPALISDEIGYECTEGYIIGCLHQHAQLMSSSFRFRVKNGLIKNGIDLYEKNNLQC